METVKFIGLICFTWLFTTGAAPIQFIKNFFGVGDKSTPKDVTRLLLQKLLNCSLCMGFWFGLIFYQNLWMACIISLTSEATHKVITKLNNYFNGL